MRLCILGNQARSTLNFWSVLARRALRDGHDTVFAVPPGDAESEAGLRAIASPDGVRHARVARYALDRKGLNPLRDLATLAALRRLLIAERPDILLASTIKPVIYGCLAARLARIPRVFAAITGLGYVFEADTFLKKCVSRLGVALYALALSGADGVFFQNRDDAALFRERGILDGRIGVFMTRGVGVDVRKFAPAPLPPLPDEAVPPEDREIVFLLVARLLVAKGLPEYAEAARMLGRRFPRARFQVLGPAEPGPGGIPESRMRAWMDEGVIEYLGETRDVRPFMAAAHVIVLPSWREGTPTAVMEALAMGRPAVVTDAPGCRETVRDGENGLLCAVRDPASLAAAMERLILHPAEIARMGAAGTALARAEFDAELVAEGMLRDMDVRPEAAETAESGTSGASAASGA